MVLKIQRVSLLGRIANISLFGEKAVLRVNVFTVEGPGKENGVPCFTVGDGKHDEVTKLKDFNMEGGRQYIEKADATSRKGVILQLGIRDSC